MCVLMEWLIIINSQLHVQQRSSKHSWLFWVEVGQSGVSQQAAALDGPRQPKPRLDDYLG